MMDEGVKYVGLQDGRKIAYRELGMEAQTAKRSLLVLHGLGSSRLAAMPGVDEDLLKEFGVRLVSIDRPGYGRSDNHVNQTLRSTAMDIEAIADKLNLGEKIWLLGFSGGGSFCWAAARYIPHRIAGIALWAPIGNFWWKGISEEERNCMLATVNNKYLFTLLRILPAPLLFLYVRYAIAPRAGDKWVKRCQTKLSAPDRQHLRLQLHAGAMLRDNLESLTLNKGFGVATDMKLFSSYWGFEPEDVAAVYKGRIHIWQGDEDVLIPLSMQQWIQRRIPNVVDLHVLPGEGHISWFCFNPKAHRTVLAKLFTIDATISDDVHLT